MDRLIRGLFATALALVVLHGSTLELESLTAAMLTVSFVLVAVCLFCQHAYSGNDTHASVLLPVQIGLAASLVGAILWQTQADGLRLGGLFGVGAAMVTLSLVQADGRSYGPVVAPYLLGYALVVGVFFSHALTVAPTSGLATFPVLAAVVLGLCLFVLPRYLPLQSFLRAIALIATVGVVSGLLPWITGDYSVGSAEISPWALQPLPVVGIEAPVIRSAFANPNTLGVLVFPGVIAAAIEAVRSTRREDRLSTALFGTLTLVNGVGLLLTNSRSAMLAAAVGLAIYGCYVVLGRCGVPIGVLGVGAVVSVFLIGIATILPIDAAHRFELWRAGLEAYLDSPTLYGRGLIDTSEVIAPFAVEGARGYSVHNSYLSILLRTGLVGAAGYLLFVVGPIVHGTVRWGSASPAAIALASAFALHQLFEGYTLYQFGPGSVLGALAVGYVIASLGPRTGDDTRNVSDREESRR